MNDAADPLAPQKQRGTPAETVPCQSPEVRRRLLPWLLLMFFGSGCAALIYEIVWLQLLQLVIGLTNLSLGILLGTFMGGMCLGSLLLARCVPARRHPLRVYAVLELGIGLIGLAVLWAMPGLGQIYAAWAGPGIGGMMLRGVLAVICLLPPTLLMGATLPAMGRWVERTPQGVSWLGFFYGGNIAGAVFGCLLAGFYLLRLHNVYVATYVAASINAGLAFISWTLAASARHTAETRDTPATLEDRPAAGAWAIYATIALSGVGALAAEVVWTRLLSLILGATVYTFSIILAVFLLGLGIGSSLGALLGRELARPRIALGLCQALLVAATAWGAYMITSSVPYWPVNPALALSPWLTFQLDLARALWAILPSAILWGASFPLALASVAGQGRDPGEWVGRVYAANTVGAIVGALGFSLAAVPWLGTHWAQRLQVVLPAMAAIIALTPAWRISAADESRASGRSGLSLATLAGFAALAGITTWLTATVPATPWPAVAYGRFTATYTDRFAPGIIPENRVPSGSAHPDIFCTYMGEGMNGSVVVTKWRSGVRNFHSAGKVQASNDPRDMRLQRMLGHIPAMIHPNPQSVLVVACGAGVTAGSFVPHPEVKRIVICDIEPLVPKFVAPLFELENHAVLKDPRTVVVYDDGRHFMRTSKEKFDIITSDPIDPWVKGCAALNTVEYYEMCKQRLNPGGIMALWIPLYESGPDTIKSVLATFFKAFPNGILWSNDTDGEGYDAVLFGQIDPVPIDLDKLQARLNRPDHAAVKKSMQDAGFRTVLSMLATYAGRATDLQGWMREAQINTDKDLRLQYLAGLWLNTYLGKEILDDIKSHYRFPDDLFSGSDQSKLTLRIFIEGQPHGSH